MRWCQFGNRTVMLPLPKDKLPREDSSAYAYLDNCQITSQNVYLIVGDIKQGLGITFTFGKKDAYAAVLILYENGIGYVDFPNDSDWLEVFSMLFRWNTGVTKERLLSLLVDLMQFAVGQQDVTMEMLQQIFGKVHHAFPDVQGMIKDTLIWWCVWFFYACIAEENYRNASGGPTQLGGLIKLVAFPDVQGMIKDTLIWWCVWFFYACIAEENYRNASGGPTQLGGLIKLVAFIECFYEGWDIRDACDHYKVEYYYTKYDGDASIVHTVTEKCREYGISRYVRGL